MCAALFIARIDTPFLAPGVGRIGKIELDSYPISYRKDLLLHEAHRHPYIERLGMLILLKLRLGSRFGRNPHACWRLLFMVALCPWLAKYRVVQPTSNDDDGVDDDEKEKDDESAKNVSRGASSSALPTEEKPDLFEQASIRGMVTSSSRRLLTNDTDTDILRAHVLALQEENGSLREQLAALQQELSSVQTNKE